MTLAELIKVHKFLTSLIQIESFLETDFGDELDEAIDLVWRDIRLKKLDPRKNEHVRTEVDTKSRSNSHIPRNEG